jgi:hypothetical protein
MRQMVRILTNSATKMLSGVAQTAETARWPDEGGGAAARFVACGHGLAAGLRDAWSSLRCAAERGVLLVGVVAQAEQPLLWRLAPPQRTRVVAALAVVVLLGAILLLFAWWAARVTRRYLRRESRRARTSRTPGVGEDDWARKPLYAEPAEDDVERDDAR